MRPGSTLPLSLTVHKTGKFQLKKCCPLISTESVLPAIHGMRLKFAPKVCESSSLWSPVLLTASWVDQTPGTSLALMPRANTLARITWMVYRPRGHAGQGVVVARGVSAAHIVAIRDPKVVVKAWNRSTG